MQLGDSGGLIPMKPWSCLLLSTAILFPCILDGGKVSAFDNEIRIKVAQERLLQCGINWNPEWSAPSQGIIWVMGEKVVEFDLKNQEDCNRITTVNVDVPENFKIDVLVEVFTTPNNFRMNAPLTTVAANRVWNVNFFNDSAWGEEVSTNWNTQTNTVPNTTGYQLYFNGKLVSGPDAVNYTREQAEQNCKWNIETKPNINIGCVYNGQTFLTNTKK